ncbi:hypothetical protein [Actinomycetospora cinnamomea]|uniref:hypothetical protein n=1 Tax=Actinomycetospora cinnamomea TaxID=663609 RepID=UPI000E319956|nr:hypothetical protein [Actinomycetospora cinnamomea]
MTDALSAMVDHGTSRPAGVDRFDWSSDTLDELARAVVAIGEIVERSTARSLTEEDPDGIAARARELATAIVCCRNSLLVESAATRLRRTRPDVIRSVS